MPEVQEKFETPVNPSWCPGCGDWAIFRAFKTTFENLGLKNENIAISYGVGCSGNMASHLRVYGFHGLHGRPLPVASGIKMANHKLTVLAAGGDGDGYGEGIAHFIHQMRANQDLTYVVFDNQVYGLTKGQVSPRAQKGFVSPTTPAGVIEQPVNPIAMALVNNATFVARAYAPDMDGTVDLLTRALKHRGFALVNIIQPCQTFNKVNTHDYWRKRIYHLPKSFPVKNREQALQRAFEGPDPKFPIGVFFQERRPTYEEELPQLKKNSLVRSNLQHRSVNRFMRTLQ